MKATAHIDSSSEERVDYASDPTHEPDRFG
jgi:hypothetical protein